jgi:hypothetical protein
VVTALWSRLLLLVAGYVVAVGLLLGAAWGASFPGSDEVLELLLGWFCCLSLGAWGLVAFFVVRSNPRPGRRTSAAWLGAGLAICLCLALVFGLVRTDALLRLRFDLSRDAFSAAVQDGQPERLCDASIGLYTVEYVLDASDGTVLFYIPESQMLARVCGFAHTGDRRLADRWGPELDLGGGWWSFCYLGGW